MIDTAVVVCPRDGQPEAAALDVDVAGLKPLTRALLTAQHAGFSRLVVVASADQQAALRRQVEIEPRLAASVRWAEAVSDRLAASPCVVMVPWVVLQAGTLRAWRQGVDAVETASCPRGSDVGPWAVSASLAGACVDAAREGVTGLQRFRERVDGQGRLRVSPWEGAPPEVVDSAAAVPGAERRLLRAGRSVEDGPLVDRFVNRTLSERITRVVVRWPVTPNQVTLLSLLTGLLGAWLLVYDGTATTLCGLALFQLSVVLDHTDGEIARLKFQFSRFGKWLDNFSDHVVDLAVIAGVAWRVAGGRESAAILGLGIAAAVGVTGSFLVVFWWSLTGPRAPVRKKGQRGADPLGAMANRDGFCLAVWATLLIGRPAWFLWTLAIGSNVYWIVWLAVHGIPVRAKTGQRRDGAAGTRPDAVPRSVDARDVAPSPPRSERPE